MQREDELFRIARALRKQSAYFSSDWNIVFLAAFIRDGGSCAYCGRDTLAELCVACGDHLLPKAIYPSLARNVDNLVPACAPCNRIKSNYDPSDGRGMQIVLSDYERSRLVERSRVEIDRRKSEYQRDYETGRDAFVKAVVQYRQSLGSNGHYERTTDSTSRGGK